MSIFESSLACIVSKFQDIRIHRETYQRKRERKKERKEEREREEGRKKENMVMSARGKWTAGPTPKQKAICS